MTYDYQSMVIAVTVSAQTGSVSFPKGFHLAFDTTFVPEQVGKRTNELIVMKVNYQK